MFNMRIDIIRKELERRFKEVEELQPQEATDDQIKEACNRFLHFLLTEPLIKPFVLELSNFNEKFVQSDQFEPIKVDIISAVKGIISEINRSGFIDDELKTKLQQQYEEEIEHPFIFGHSCSYPDEYIQELDKIEQYSDRIIYELDTISGRLEDIFYIANNFGKSYDRTKFDKFTDMLRECKESLIAYVRTKASYEGAISLNKLLLYYLISPNEYKILSEVKPEDFGEGVTKAVLAATESAEPSIEPATIDYCHDVYHAVDKFLSSSKSKSFLIDRLLTYCRWIKREEFPKPKEKNRELKISRVIEEFLFNHGYFPLVNFKMGKSIPDILSAPGIDLRWDNSVLVELKQIIGKTSYTPSDLITDIGQAQDYLSDVKGVNPGIVDTVYLLIFYDGKTRQTIPESVDVPDNVRIEFVYVGGESPSELRAPEILKVPKTTIKKKLPKKKAAKKSKRKK